MNPPEKCESLRRAIIYCTNLADLDELSSEARLDHKVFDETRWRWMLCVSHDVLPLLAPGAMARAFDSVYAFNKMVERAIAYAIAGEPTDEQPSLFQQMQQAQAQQLSQRQAQQAAWYQGNPVISSPITWSTSTLGGLWPTGGQQSTTTSGTPSP